MDYTDYLKFFFALILVLCLMGGLAFILKKLGIGQGQGMISPKFSKDKKRLKIVEILPLDARRRAMLIRRDQKEHLVIFSATGETVVETNIDASNDDAT